MPLSDIVNVQITRQTQTVSEPGFGTLLILGENKNWNDLLRQYNNMTQVAADFNPYELEFIAAQDVFSQPITPPFIFIGRRTVDEVGISVETAMPNQNYTVNIQGIANTINSNTSVNDSVLTLTGIVTWTITFPSSSITSGAIITPTINGATATAAITDFDTNQTTTLSDLATNLATYVGGSATSTATSVTLVFPASSSSVVDSVIVSGQSSPPVATLTQDGPLVASNSIAVYVNGVQLSASPFTFATSSLATMTTIATDIAAYLNSSQSVYSPGIATCVVSGPNNNVLTVTSNPNQAGVVTEFTVSSGSSQATAAIVNTSQPTDANTIADSLKTYINANSGVNRLVVASVPSVPNGTLLVNVNVTYTPLGTPYTISVSTDIGAPNQARVVITQAIPNQAYTVRINGYHYVYIAPTDVADNEQISLGLANLINSATWINPNGLIVANPLAGIVSATDNGNGTLEVVTADSTNSMNLVVFPLEAMYIQKGLIIGPYTPSASVVNDLIAIQGVNDNWYALACTDRTVATVEAIAAWIETQVKISEPLQMTRILFFILLE
jgi:hypothetical protein